MKKIFFTLSLFLIINLITITVAKTQNAGCNSVFDIVKDSMISSSPYAYLYIDKSTGTNIVSWSWDFGDNTLPSTEQFPMHIYQAAGKYEVCLTIKTKKDGVVDCESKSCQTLYVHPPDVYCTASFYYYGYDNNSDSTMTYPPNSTNTFYFVNNSGGNITKTSWDFGDGSKSEEANTVHTFSPGNYEVCLTIDGFTSDDKACQDKYCENITISQPNLCYADFFSFTDSPESRTYSFADASKGNPKKWYWNFGDDSTSTQRNPVHGYGKSGNYRVCLTIIDDEIGCKDMRCYDIFVGIPENYCSAGFYYFPDTKNYSIQFADKSKGNASHFLWSFGDGEVSTEQSPNHEYKKPGVYEVCLSISDSIVNGCSDNYCETVFVPEKPSSCKASFNLTPEQNPDIPDYYKFTDTSTGNPNEWYWEFGDGTTDNTQNPKHQYKQSGIFYPCLTITNKTTGCNAIYCSQIFIGNSCHAEYSYYKDPSVVSMPSTEVYYFNDNSKGDISSWYWNFGDGTNSSEANPMHIFYPGTYKVCLTISSDANQNSICSDTYCSIITVDSANIPPAPSCNNFIIHVNDVKDSLSVHFYGNSYYSQAPVTFSWDFGDGSNPTDKGTQNPIHKYVHTGSYIVKLTTTDANNCTFTSEQTVFIGSETMSGSLSGQVFAGSHNMDKAVVIIASFDNNANAFSYLDTTYVDSYGAYQFNKLPFGNYYILAVPMKDSKYAKEYMPTFYGDKWDWADASVVSVGDIMPSVQIDIHLLYYKNFVSGPGIIQGFVAYGGIKPEKKGAVSSGS